MENRTKKKRFTRKTRQNLLLLTAVVVTAGVVFLIQYGSGVFSKVRQESKSDAATTFNLDQGGFDAFLERGTVGQLVEVLQQLEAERSDDLVVWLDQLNRQIRIADQILKLQPDDTYRKLAIASKFNSLMDRKLIVWSQQSRTGSHSEELKRFADRFQESEELELRSLAATAAILDDVTQFLDSHDPDSRQELLNSIIQRVRTLTEEYPDDVEVAKRLLEILLLVNRNCDYAEFHPLLTAYLDSYSPPESDVIEALVRQARGLQQTEQIEFEDILAVDADRLDASIELLQKQIDESLASVAPSESLIMAIIARINDLIAVDRMNQALEIFAKAKRKTAEAGSDSLISRMNVIDNQLQSVGSRIELKHLLDQNGQPAVFSPDAPRYKVLLFVSDQSLVDSTQKFKQLLAANKQRIEESSLAIVLVYVHDSSNRAELASMQEAAELSKHVTYWFLNQQPEGQRQLLQDYGLDPLPGWMLLEDEQIRAVNPSAAGMNLILEAGE